MATNGYSSRDLTGYNVYHLHENNQTIYYDNLTKKAYIITNQYVNSFSTWQTRLPISVIVAAVLILFRANPLMSIVWGIVVYIGSSILFHMTFLKKLPIKKNFTKPKSKGFFRDIAGRYPIGILRIITFMFAALAVVMIVNQIVNKFEDAARTITYVFATISIVCACLMGYITYLKKKENI